MSRKERTGMVLATAAAVVFTTIVATPVAAETAAMACYGGNACKGQSSCHTIKNGCNGENSCKGRGMAMLSTEDCETAGGSPNPPAP